MNLVQNSIRYSHSKVVINILECEQNYQISINDRGPGIPEDKIEDVFQPFYRIESSRSDKTGGSGLGLSIAREICNANKWGLHLKPRDGGGLCAQIILTKNT